MQFLRLTAGLLAKTFHALKLPRTIMTSSEQETIKLTRERCLTALEASCVQQKLLKDIHSFHHLYHRDRTLKPQPASPGKSS